MNRIYISLVLLASLWAGELCGQRIVRSVISSIGDSGTGSNGIRVACTGAQPPNAGTIVAGGAYLRQGFQQPPISGGDINPDCINAPLAEFLVQDEINSCGQYFSFFYTDIPEANTKFLWKFEPNGMPAFSTKSDPAGVGFVTTGTKTVTLTVTTGNCIFTTTQSITVIKAAFGAVSQTVGAACFEDGNGVAKLTVVNGTPPYEIAWANGATTASIENLSPGAYEFTVSDATGCEFSSEAIVEGPDSIRIEAAVTVETCHNAKDGAIDLSVSGGVTPYLYAWSNLATTEDLTALNGGTYTVTIEDANGCMKSGEIKVLTVCEGFEFNNLITPNGDGSNETWIVPDIDKFPDNELEVFNRWGDIVYMQKAYDNTWRGTNSGGNPLPVGAYWYVLRLNDPGNTVFTGSVSILR